MIKEAMAYLLDLKRPELVEMGERIYSTSQLHPMKEPVPNPLEIHTLTGLVDYIGRNPDGLVLNDILIHVAGHDRVSVCSRLFGQFRQRATMVEVVPPKGNPYPFGNWLDIETFVIELQTKFVPSDTTRALLTLVSNIKEERVSQSKDDGISQTVVAKMGISLVQEVSVPNPVFLRPYRTFHEVAQPVSPYVFRLRTSDKLPQCSLHEADGGGWKQEAINLIEGYLAVNIPDTITIIA
jgi:hypothetical protein